MDINIEENFIFKEKDIIVIGCSTGPDSMALLDMLLKLRRKYNLQIICAHVNHNLRKQSVEEAEFMKKYCDDNDIVFEMMIIEKYGDDNFHNEARNIRYHFFENIVDKYCANYLMTAHHGDDLIETILMRMTRGSNLQGYSGFHKIVDMGHYRIIRPLITYTKKEIENYNIKHNVPYYIDDSNSKMKYTRNRYRKYVLPFLKEEDNNGHRKFLKFSNNVEEASKYIVNDKHIELLLNLISSKKANMRVNLPNEIVAIKSYNDFYLKRETDGLTAYEIEFSNYAELPNRHIIKKIEKTDEKSNNVCRLSSTEISLPLIIRTRKLGDRMYVKGLNGKKKIKDIFIENKINLQDRDLWPIVMDSSGKIVWLPGLKKSKFDKSKEENYDIIMKYC